MFRFDYLRPKSVEECCGLLEEFTDKAKIIAGGTDLMVQIRDKDKRFKNINYVIDITHLETQLHYLTENDDYVFIGPLTTHTELEGSDIVQNAAKFLSHAASTVGSPQIRNRGTIGGSIGNASPAADPLTPLIALDALVKITGTNGVRESKLKDLYIKSGVLDLKPGEMITEILFHKLPDGSKTAFEKLGRRKALAISRLNTSVILHLDDAGLIDFARIAPGCIFATPDRVESAEQLLLGKKPSVDLFFEAGKEVSAEMIRRTGIRWSTEYKQPAIEALVQRALLKALGMEGEIDE